MALEGDFSSLPQVTRAIINAQSVDGVPFRARTNYMHRTWARTFTCFPELFIQPRCQQEVEKAVNLARFCGRRLVTVGSGHSPSDMTCTSSWMINLDKLDRVISVDVPSGRVTVQAGIRLHQLSAFLDSVGLALPSLGSINEQSIAGAISTGTHGSSLWHGLVSECVVALNITLANGVTRTCSPTDDPDLFRAALLSLGALGIITEVTIRAVPAFTLRWRQEVGSEASMLERWDKDLWSQAEFVRVWWLPYTKRAVVWKAGVLPSEDPLADPVKPSVPPQSFQDSRLGYFVYHNLLALARIFPRITPWVEWFVFGLQYGFRNGPSTRVSGVQPSHQAFLMNCLYSQFVDEWAIPLSRGPEALRRLGAFLRSAKPGDPDYVDHRMPFDAEGMFVHAPIEVRVSNTVLRTSAKKGNRPLLDPTPKDEPALYINATMYRPYHREPRGTLLERYYRAFEWLMRDLGGKPHWAKTFYLGPDDFREMYGADWDLFLRQRAELDPKGMFVGPWHRRFLLGLPGDKCRPGEEFGDIDLEEAGFVARPASGGGILVEGRQIS